ncbi:plasmid stabilization protein [Spirochaetia bacterium]|nr:plasmid stabilization protein [Spirochaetia bacterium]
MKTWKVIIAPEANDRMYDHFEFLARVSGTAAIRLLETLTEDIKSLETMPFVSPFFDRSYLPKGKYRYKLSYQRYRIVYQIEGDTVYVDDIQDCRQDDDKNLI